MSISSARAVDRRKDESLKETIAVLSDRDLMRQVRRGLAALSCGKARWYTVQELFK